MPLIMRLAAFALDLIFPPRPSQRIVRSLSHADAEALLSPRTFAQGTLSITGLLPYRAPAVRALVIEAKFHGDQHAVRLLGRILAIHLQEHMDSVLVPIPLSPQRQKRRGYNQAELIAREARSYIRYGPTVCSTLLGRIRDTRAQSSLGRADRRDNVRDAFRALRPVPAAPYLLVDDVITTGATLAAAACAMRAAGATEVSAVALAYAGDSQP